ncbi:hypothetical protein FGG08_007287 [Glutinoglossum americanum]|uniref:Heterokaryon incompatibility domain-containing protein n=1 Tax=Glutinoglossum americanum TaxID=1670608 RepID=A0A9P8I5N7_9PEZI|nr:hypothetical protein FGG08_007287 [Glutinoglossum americanum]
MSSTTATAEHQSDLPIRTHEETELALCGVCHVEKWAKSFKSLPSSGPTRDSHGSTRVSLRKLIENADHCEYCKFLLQTCGRDPTLYGVLNGLDGTLALRPTRTDGLVRVDLEGWFEKDKWAGTFKSRILQMFPSGQTLDNSKYFSGRMVESEVDFGLCRSWLQLCSDSHQDSCQEEAMDRGRLVGFRLVDVNRRCVVEAPAGAQYVALSYVWGADPFLKLEKGTWKILSSVGRLSDKHLDVPRTFLDAIAIASMLGFSYLWIDALCITQDDEQEKENQIGNMDLVYSCATFTIVCTGPSACAELPGLRRSSSTPNQTICKLGDIELINTQPTLSQALSLTPWDSRGWTLQEKTLSKRLLIFTTSQVFWHCNSAVYSEDTVLETPRNTKRSLASTVEDYEEYSAEIRRVYKASPKASAMQRYEASLRSYIKRDLKYQSDALKAFAGILKILSPRLGEHFWGLPTRNFDTAMLWTFDSHFPTLRRREFPSWSWAGWQGGENVDMHEGPSKPLATIWWWKVGESGLFALVNPPGDSEVDSGYTNDHFGVVSSSPPPSPAEIHNSQTEAGPREPFNPPPESTSPASHILRFWTSTAQFLIDRNPLPARRKKGNLEGFSEYGVRIPGEKDAITSVVLSKEWREEHEGDQFEVIFLSRVSDGGRPTRFLFDVKVWTLLIEWKQGIAYRVQQFSFPIRFVQWRAAKPQFKLITLA